MDYGNGAHIYVDQDNTDAGYRATSITHSLGANVLAQIGYTFSPVCAPTWWFTLS